ncbi:sorbitol dehydrogenase [Grosmannia clavigera kw1407]|uniref:Sorbitol dehydrogenase n=1 Tax=Grosmannia clavigera (strain kw1407 / UAMH 11150) TaxID=655863 RepID=F0XLI3_GROCL|nr:sorbitol dehydrogenase [Grosmannia clavigera kw1407]EFX01004.1 sorbitol dehydrogenase [Grosmannia clavigera kw1407]
MATSPPPDFRSLPFFATTIASAKYSLTSLLKGRPYRQAIANATRSFSSGSPLWGQLDAKRIIVTGGSQGIGESVVRAYAAEGATVVSMDVKDAVGIKVAEESTAAGPGTVTYKTLDITSKSAVTSAFAAAAEELGGLDVLVHVAGIHKHAPSDDSPEDFIELITKINIWGTLFTNAAAYQLMKKGGQGGAIINFGSEAGLTSEVSNAYYGMTKGAVHTWTRSVAREWRPAGVGVNAVLPYVATPMYYGFRDALSPEQLKEHMKLLKEQFPLGGNLGDPAKDLVPVMVFLASDASHWMTGQLFPVDGGFIALR